MAGWLAQHVLQAVSAVLQNLQWWVCQSTAAFRQLHVYGQIVSWGMFMCLVLTASYDGSHPWGWLKNCIVVHLATVNYDLFLC